MDGRRIPPGPPRPAVPNVGLPLDPEPVEACVTVMLTSLAVVQPTFPSSLEWHLVSATRATFEPHLEERYEWPETMGFPRVKDRIDHMVLTFVEDVRIVGTALPMRTTLDPIPYYSMRGWFELEGNKALIECDQVQFEIVNRPEVNPMSFTEPPIITVTTRASFTMRFDGMDVMLNSRYVL